MSEPTTKMKPAAAYLRRSTDRQEQSIRDQRTELQRRAEEDGYRIGDEYEYKDDAISGTSVKGRKAFLRARTDNPMRLHQFHHPSGYADFGSFSSS